MEDVAKKDVELQGEIMTLETQIAGLKITDDAEYANAVEVGRQLKSEEKKIKDFFKPMKDRAYAAHKEICNKEKSFLKPLNDAGKVLKNAIGEYVQEKERLRKAQEEKMQEEIRKAVNQKLDEAENLESAGKAEDAENALTEAATGESIAMNTHLESSVPKVAGVVNKKDWQIKSVDLEKVPDFVDGVCIRPVDEKAVLKLIREHKGDIEIAGVQFEDIIKTSIRR